MPDRRLFSCEYCKYKTEKRCEFYQHINTKEHKDNGFVKKKKSVYICNCCDFGTFIKSYYTSHLKTRYHAFYSRNIYIKNVDSSTKKNVIEELNQFFKEYFD